MLYKECPQKYSNYELDAHNILEEQRERNYFIYSRDLHDEFKGVSKEYKQQACLLTQQFVTIFAIF